MSRKVLYEVYLCEYEGKIVYVGHGTKGRHKHCNGGTSHVKELNKIHFLEGSNKLTVKIVLEFNNKEDAEVLEKTLIDLHRPRYNKVYNSSVNSVANYGKITLVKKQFDEYLKDSRLAEKSVEKYKCLVDEFLNYISARDLKEGTVCLYSSRDYLNLELKHLARLSRFVRSIDSKNSPKMSNTLIFYLAVKDIYNIDLKECLQSRK